MQFIATHASEKGPRQEQQDAVGVASRKGCLLAVVCDGAGGHLGGSKASRLAVEVALEAFAKAGGQFDDPKSALLGICVDAHKEILKLGETPKLAPRSTIAILYLDGKKMHRVHVGDSRIYQLRSGKIIERTRDHTMVQILLEQGEITESEMGVHPDQGRLLRALGTDEELRPVYETSDLAVKDAFLLCTDGFWERIHPDEIEELLQMAPTQDRLNEAVAKAIKRNGPKGDNVSIMAVYPEQESTDPSPCFLRWWLLTILLLISIALVYIYLNRDSLLIWISPSTGQPAPAAERPIPIMR